MIVEYIIFYMKGCAAKITYNMETKTNKEIEEMKIIPGKMLGKICILPPSTPYFCLNRV